MTETAKQADIVLPAASAYEKNGTVTNVCGEVQRLKQAIKVMGTKTDLEIFGQIAKEMGLNLGIWLPDKVFEEIRKSVHGYEVSPRVAGDRPGRQPCRSTAASPLSPARSNLPATHCSPPDRSLLIPKYSTTSWKLLANSTADRGNRRR